MPKILMMQSKFIHPTLNGWVRWIWLILGKNAKILAPQFLKQARESARILETTTDPATFFMRYDFCVGRLLELEKCKRYGAPVSATADLKKYQNPVFREAAVNEIIHRTAEKYSVRKVGQKNTTRHLFRFCNT
jgi:hypothetical protein